MGDLEPEPPVREREDVGDRRSVPPRVRHDDDLELEPLRSVDGEQPDRVRALLLGHRVRLLRTDRLLPLDEPDEALDVRAAELLVRSRESRELSQVRVPAPAVGQREDREVVVVLGEDALAQELERRMRRDVEQALVALPEREHEPLVVLKEVSGEGTLEAPEDRLALRLRPDEDECVVRHADERRGEHGEERLVVVAVVQEPQIGEQVGDLLLPEVVPPRSAVRRQADGAELLLEPLGVRAGGEEQHDLTRCGDPCVHQLAHAAGDVPGLGSAPVHAGLAGRRLVRHEQLEGVPQRGDVGRVGGLEALELVPELAAEELVHGGEHLGPRAMVPRQRQDGRGGAATLPEHCDVGMAEPVDRLELVPDDEQVGVRTVAEKVEELGLEAVRVLELVDHDRAEPQPLALPDRLVVPEQVSRLELKILEVDGRLALLRVGVRGRERRQQLLQELAVARRQLLERGSDHRVPRLREAGGPRTARLEVAQGEEPLRKRRLPHELQRRGGGCAMGIGCLRVVAKRGPGLTERVDPRFQGRPRTRLQHEVATR
jgi:hypothetical protein